MFKFFLPYVVPFEKKVDKFLLKLNSKSSCPATQKKLLGLMQENTAILSMWLEKKSKNYAHLSKKYRSRKIENLQKIEALFQSCQCLQKLPEATLNQFGVKFNAESLERIHYLWKIMNFCRTYFYYQESSSFDKLLVDLSSEKMVGDCNQISTFYAHLYALKYPISDLKIRLFDDHVALYFQGIDIEATGGRFIQHKKEGQVLPIVEIISTNLLDIADFRERQKGINPQTFLKNAQLAFLLSSLKEIVQHNLDVALQKLIVNRTKNKEFSQAVFFYNQIQDVKIKMNLQNIFAEATKYFVEKHNFRKAKYFAKKSPKKELIDFINHNEAVFYLKKQSFTKARQIAKKLKNQNLIKNVAHNEYAFLGKTVKDVKTIVEAKKKKHVYQKMLQLAKESKKVELEKFPREVLKKIN